MIDRSHWPHLSFDIIAEEWAKDDAAPGNQAEIFELLIQGMWRGEFEIDGEFMLAMPYTVGVLEQEMGLAGAINLDERWARAALYEVEFMIRDEGPRLTPSPGQCEPGREPPPPPTTEMFQKLARRAVPGRYDEIFIEAYLKRLWIGRVNFAAWLTSNNRPLPEFWYPGGQIGTSKSSTIGAEGRCKNWLVEMMKNGSREKPKRDYLTEATTKFQISGRGFDRAWQAAIAETGNHKWAEGGRPRNQ
jgi:hypothetical protein